MVQAGLVGEPNAPDDRWVFTENNPARELEAAAGMAAAARVLKGYNNELAGECLKLARELWENTKETNPMQRVQLAVELLQATGDNKYSECLTRNTSDIAKNIDRTGWIVGRTLSMIKDSKYSDTIIAAVKAYRTSVDEQEKKTPY
jgi:hypothetical protein